MEDKVSLAVSAHPGVDLNQFGTRRSQLYIHVKDAVMETKALAAVHGGLDHLRLLGPGQLCGYDTDVIVEFASDRTMNSFVGYKGAQELPMETWPGPRSTLAPGGTPLACTEKQSLCRTPKTKM